MEVLDARSLAFAEDFVECSEALRSARDQAIVLQAPVISGGTAAALTVLTRAVQATAVVEVGTGTGESGLAFFEGMAADGVLTSIDSRAQWQLEARKAFLGRSIPTRRFRLIPGNPLGILNNLRDGAYDVVFINGDKLEFVEYLAQALRLLRHGGLAIMNNALWHNKIADPGNDDDEAVIIREALQSVIETEEFTSALLPVGEGLLVAVRA
ncbi:Predicted O-methyltransferase YrrM [Propionibacterium cyclohexanicum]|uniref:Predicted O-methyltransferase YrrM n=1 Tax=Propionibacterium cyclohexanicum TaxID=64702 RepID=A0A1H9PGX5_9ACTN|nr:class I SAM-dependent methyltransferase [Propionibacterium cyclohexanicum]SER47115.1 Predicted O-methyltransferase YrrM [Propionibacterium cyclohexanicum]